MTYFKEQSEEIFRDTECFLIGRIVHIKRVNLSGILKDKRFKSKYFKITVQSTEFSIKKFFTNKSEIHIFINEKFLDAIQKNKMFDAFFVKIEGNVKFIQILKTIKKIFLPEHIEFGLI